MRLKVSYIIIILLAIALQADAQRRSSKKRKKAPAKTQQKATAKQQDRSSEKDTVLKGTTIEIIQSYNPEVKSTPKPEFKPALPPADTKNPLFSYDVPKQSLYYTYNSMPIRPLALGKEQSTPVFANYVKLGGGNQSTLYLDGGIGSLKGENYETAIQLKHLSQTGEYKDQKVSLSGIDATGTLHRNEHAWTANIGMAHNQYHYYGYNHEVFNYNIDSVKQAYTSLRIGLGMKNEYEGFKNIDYNPTVSFSSYTDRHEAAEQTARFDVPLSYNVDTSLQLHLGLSATVTQYSIKSAAVGNNILQFSPGLSYHKEAFKIHAAIKPTFGKNGTYLLPDIEAAYKIKNSQYSINAGWVGSLQQNSFEQLSTQNPFMYNTYLVQQTKITDVFGGVQGNIGNHITLSGRVSYCMYNDMPMFINDTATADKKQFRVVYDKVSSMSLQASLRYQVANTFSVGFNAALYNYSAETFRHAWHMPAATFKGDLLFNPLPELTVTAYLSVMDGIYGLDKNNVSVKLDPIMDIGGGAEYNFIPRLSAFMQVNNLLNNKYQRWYGYDAYGLNIFGGLRLKF